MTRGVLRCRHCMTWAADLNPEQTENRPKIAAMTASTPKMTEAMASSSVSARSDRELAATTTTQQPAPISSDVARLNTMIHSTAKTSPLRITATAMRRAGLLFDAGRTAGSGEFMTGNPLCDDPDFVVAEPEQVQPEPESRALISFRTKDQEVLP